MTSSLWANYFVQNDDEHSSFAIREKINCLQRKNQSSFSKLLKHIELLSIEKIQHQHHRLVQPLMQLRCKALLRISHSIRTKRETRIKARNIITIILQSIERGMKNAYAKKNISSKNAHTSSNSIEKEGERRTKMWEMTCVKKSRKDWWFIESSNTSSISTFWTN